MSQPDGPFSESESIIGQITHHLDHMAEMLYAIDDHEGSNYRHHRHIAFVDSFLLDFRALYYFLLGPNSTNDAHRLQLVDTKAWPRPKTEATKRMDKLVRFISKHRAHLSKSRFAPERPSLEDLLGVSALSAEYLGRVLLDFLDLLDEFIVRLPDTRESAKGSWQGAVYNARYKAEVALGVRESAFPDDLKPLTAVVKRSQSVAAPGTLPPNGV